MFYPFLIDMRAKKRAKSYLQCCKLTAIFDF